jgi:outer membrane lipoprotein-sorting protein
MGNRHLTRLAGAAGLALLAGAGGLAAQEKPTAPAGQVSTGAVGSGWTAQTQAGTGTTGVALEPKQIEAIKKVSQYFNELNNLKGAFVQTSADKKRERGKFYVKRPGRFRFDYGAPSKQVIISDGKYLAIQDHDLKTEDVVELDNTPFRLLLRKDVDLMRDARILEVHEAEDLIILTLQDKSPDAPGRIKLFLAKMPTLDLKEWVTTDAQGLETRVELTDLNKTEELDTKLFERKSFVGKAIQ